MEGDEELDRVADDPPNSGLDMDTLSLRSRLLLGGLGCGRGRSPEQTSPYNRSLRRNETQQTELLNQRPGITSICRLNAICKVQGQIWWSTIISHTYVPIFQILEKLHAFMHVLHSSVAIDG
jgi:hypothetical protein